VERAFRESVDDYLAFCRERGEEPNQPCSGRFVVRVDPKLHRSASALAKAMNKSLNAFVADAVAHEVERRRREI
jgi:predicted HicB family RNase H-like nuclease